MAAGRASSSTGGPGELADSGTWVCFRLSRRKKGPAWAGVEALSLETAVFTLSFSTVLTDAFYVQ